MTPFLLFLWGPPRSLSTAFLRMMLERGDFLVVHEPFSSIVVQGHAVFEGNEVKNPSTLFALLRQEALRKPVFVKETTEYRYDLIDDPDFADSVTHTFITRHPRAAIASHYAMNADVTCAEIGFEYQYEVFRAVREATGRRPAIVEAESLMADPHTAVRGYCQEVGIPFLPAALSWEPGDRQEWCRTSEWHREVANSRGFRACANSYPVGVHNHDRLSAFYDYHLPFYEKMSSARLDLAGS